MISLKQLEGNSFKENSPLTLIKGKWQQKLIVLVIQRMQWVETYIVFESGCGH